MITTLEEKDKWFINFNRKMAVSSIAAYDVFQLIDEISFEDDRTEHNFFQSLENRIRSKLGKKIIKEENWI